MSTANGPWPLPGGPRPPRSCRDRATSPTTAAELDALRRRVWREQGVRVPIAASRDGSPISLAIDDVTDPWLRQALINEATRRWGARGGRHGA
jgi:hypothetical protein